MKSGHCDLRCPLGNLMILSYQTGNIGGYRDSLWIWKYPYIEFRCFTIDFYRASRGARVINIFFALLLPNRINFTVNVSSENLVENLDFQLWDFVILLGANECSYVSFNKKPIPFDSLDCAAIKSVC